ncbi:MAG: VCBS repeat-containing protein [Bacteroidota bacterium]
MLRKLVHIKIRIPANIQMKKLGFIYGFIFLLLACSGDQNSSTTQSDQPDKNQTEQDHNTERLFKLLSAERTGIDFRNDLEDDALNNDKNVMSWPHYYNGGGVAIGDLNNDGLQDVILSGNEVDNRIYLNKGDLKFEDVTEGSNINKNKKWSTGVSLADVNQDGWLDIYFCQASPFDKSPNERRNLLFINNRDMTFTESAKRFGLDDGNHSVQSVFFDMDKDGDLDCFVYNSSRYVRVQIGTVLKHLEKKENLEAASSNLYRNDGAKFTRITEEAGMLKYGFALGNFISDLNGDGYMDIYQANDYSVPDFMYINQGDGTFKDEVKQRTRQLSWFAMGADCADINNDGHQDIGVVDMAATDHVRGKTLMAPMDPELFKLSVEYLKNQRQHMFNTLQLNNGDGTWSNIAGLAHVQNSEWSWAALFADFDNDSFKDYFVATGFRRYVRDNDSRLRTAAARAEHGGSVPMHLRKELYEQIPQVPLNNFCYHNDGDLQFHDVSKEWGMDQLTYSNGAAYADFDQDGDLDLIVNNIDERTFVYENTLDGKKNYLRFDLKSDSPKEGAKVTIESKGKIQMQEYAPVRGYISVVEPTLHFGLGDINQIDRVVVEWPDGKNQILENVNANQVIELKYADAGQHALAQNKDIEYFAEEGTTIFRHVENPYDDFDKEVLLPYAQSALGPGVSIADINGDDLDDFYVSGATNQTGGLFIQKQDGSFSVELEPFKPNAVKEEIGSAFFDADGDGDQDLYVICGGNEHAGKVDFYKDKLYINEQGTFKDASNKLPPIQDAGQRVKACDFDNDGDLDLFVGGRLKPGLYPNAPRSYLLENDNGSFTDVTEKWSTELLQPGLINDFLWTDFDADGKQDLILAGEWMPISFYKNTGTSFENVTSNYFDKEHSGWWFKLKEVDIDNDGDLDLIAGNLGLNSKFHASDKKPFEVLANDFDGNGTCDIVLTKDYKGKTVPVRGRQCSSEQMPFIEDKFETYGEFANASIEQILGKKKIDQALKLRVNTFENVIFYNNGGKYESVPLPTLAQSFPIYGIECIDLNLDGLKDIVISGNIYQMEIETPRLDAGVGLTLINNGDKTFESIGVQTGFKTKGDTKDMAIINGKTKRLIVMNNNGPMQIFEINPKSDTNKKIALK